MERVVCPNCERNQSFLLPRDRKKRYMKNLYFLVNGKSTKFGYGCPYCGDFKLDYLTEERKQYEERRLMRQGRLIDEMKNGEDAKRILKEIAKGERVT